MNRFLKNELGVAAIEYGIFSGLIATMILTSWVLFTVDFNAVLETITDNLI